MSSEQQSTDHSVRIDATELMAKLDVDRESGLLARKIRGTAEVVYGASEKIKGGVVALYRDGRCVEGFFRDGTFIPGSSDPDSAEKGP